MNHYQRLNETIDNKELHVDINTGEIIQLEIPRTKTKAARFITHPDLSSIASKQDLLDYFIGSTDKRYNNYHGSLGGGFVNEARDNIHGQKVKVFDAICNLLVIRNLVFTSVTELSGLTGFKPEVIYKSISYLAKHGYIKMIRKNAGDRGNYLIEISPVWCWRGDRYTRKHRLENFCSGAF